MELQRAADSNNMKGFYNGLKEVWGPKKKGPNNNNNNNNNKALLPYSTCKSYMINWNVVWR